METKEEILALAKTNSKHQKRANRLYKQIYFLVELVVRKNLYIRKQNSFVDKLIAENKITKTEVQEFFK